jgi:hypothetical protein
VQLGTTVTRIAKHKFFETFISSLDHLSLFAVRNWGKGLHQAPVPPLRRSDGKLVTSTNERATVLFEEWYNANRSMFPEAGPMLPPARDPLPDIPITDREVYSCVFGPSVKKAPGPSGISYTLLHMIWQTPLRAHFIKLVRTSLHTNVIPTQWKLATIATLPKLHKSDYTLPKAYRPISLIEVTSKVCERIIARRLGYFNQKYNLSPDQFAGAGRGTTDAAVKLLHTVAAAKSENLKTSVLKFDFSGFFNNIDQH